MINVKLNSITDLLKIYHKFSFLTGELLFAKDADKNIHIVYSIKEIEPVDFEPLKCMSVKRFLNTHNVSEVK